MKRVKFWSRISREKSHEWVLVESWDLSRVPLKAWKAFNKAFWTWKTQGKAYPLDELEAYQVAASEMVRTAEAPPRLSRASLSTYLVSAAFQTLLKYKERVVDPARIAYRAICDGARVGHGETGTSARDEDAVDREWNDRSASTLNVQAFVEALPGVHSSEREHAMHLAADCVCTTLAKLDADARAGLRAWLDADGVWVDATRRYNPNGSVQGYVYRFKHLWAPAFRRACQWIW